MLTDTRSVHGLTLTNKPTVFNRSIERERSGYQFLWGEVRSFVTSHKTFRQVSSGFWVISGTHSFTVEIENWRTSVSDLAKIEEQTSATLNKTKNKKTPTLKKTKANEFEKNQKETSAILTKYKNKHQWLWQITAKNKRQRLWKKTSATLSKIKEKRQRHCQNRITNVSDFE